MILRHLSTLMCRMQSFSRQRMQHRSEIGFKGIFLYNDFIYWTMYYVGPYLQRLSFVLCSVERYLFSTIQNMQECLFSMCVHFTFLSLPCMDCVTQDNIFFCDELHGAIYAGRNGIQCLGKFALGLNRYSYVPINPLLRKKEFCKEFTTSFLRQYFYGEQK